MPQADPIRDPVKPAAQYTKLERHVSFFQGKNWNTNYVTFNDFVETLGELEVPTLKKYIIALGIMFAGRSKTTSGSLFRPLVIHRPTVAAMIHAPADTGAFHEDGSTSYKFEEFADAHIGLATRQSVLAAITKRNGGIKPNFAQRGEFDLTFDVMERQYVARKRNTPHLTKTDVAQLYDGSLFFKVVGRPVPWES
jgi:hypothetical protein